MEVTKSGRYRTRTYDLNDVKASTRTAENADFPEGFEHFSTKIGIIKHSHSMLENAGESRYFQDSERAKTVNTVLGNDHESLSKNPTSIRL